MLWPHSTLHEQQFPMYPGDGTGMAVPLALRTSLLLQAPIIPLTHLERTAGAAPLRRGPVHSALCAEL